MSEKCPHCEFLSKTFPGCPGSGEKYPMSNREYWLFTEVFCYLHNGKDECEGILKT